MGEQTHRYLGLSLVTLGACCRADRQGDGGVRGPPRVFAAGVIAVGQVSERLRVDVLGGSFAPGQHIEPVRVQVREQGRGPPAAFEPDQDPPLVPDRRSSPARDATGSASTSSTGSVRDAGHGHPA